MQATVIEVDVCWTVRTEDGEPVLVSTDLAGGESVHVALWRT